MTSATPVKMQTHPSTPKTDHHTAAGGREPCLSSHTPSTRAGETSQELEPTDGGQLFEQEIALATGSQRLHCQDSVNDSSTDPPLTEHLKFRASRNTDRIYVYAKDGSPLNCSFIPMDIKLDSWEDLPEQFSRKENRMQVLRFVREWSALTAMKQRVIRRSARLFQSPIVLLEELTGDQRRRSVTKRYLTKEDVAHASLGKAQMERGTVRLVTKDTFFTRKKSTQQSGTAHDKGDGSFSDPRSPQETGFLQAVDSTGTPLCLSCQSPCGAGGTWDQRFCQRRCQEDFQVRSSQAYMRARVFETEHGVCQHCGLQAHQLFQRIRDAVPAHRKEMLEGTWLARLPLRQLNEIIRSPTEGQFWQVDHIRPVYRGGGQCSLDNLQTLCTVCHRERTAQQAKDRSRMRKEAAVSRVASDITRFFIRK